jgi:folate-binding protein YgfZ
MTALLVDRSARFRMTFTGEKAKEALGGLVTNDVVSLGHGQGQRAVALTAKGRVIAMVRVFDRGGDVLVDGESNSGEAFIAMIRKFVNPRMAKYAVITHDTACLGVYGEAATRQLAAAAGVDSAALDALAPFGILRSPDGALDIVRSADLSVPGFDVIGSPDAVAALRGKLVQLGATDASEEFTETARVERGLPRFGVDMDADTIPQEANLDVLGAISFNKGCYTGQEVVARIHFRGHVNRHLRWLSAPESLPQGATVVDGQGKEVGDVRSSVVSPTRGPLALAMVRREVEPGSEVLVRTPDREIRARLEVIA